MAKRKKEKTHPIRTFFVSIFLICILTGAICSLAFAWYIRAYIQPNADLNIDELGMNFTSFIYVKNPDSGEYYEYEKLHGQENRIWVDMEDIPDELGEAFVAIEDQRFYSHKGVDWKRTGGAVINYLTGSGSYGGSTITQQLIKNLTEDNEYSVKRKINEIFRALALEKQIDDKDRILEMYMNTIPFGQHAYGVQAAAKTYFNKDVSQLDLAECAAIAGITNAPTRYNPFRHPENTKARQTLILNAMRDQGFITDSECKKALAEPLNYQRPADEQGETEPYSYFTDTIYNDVVNDLIDKLGYSYIRAVDAVTSGGLQIYSTMNPKVQNIMETVYTDDSNFPSISKNGVKPQSAMVVLTPDGGIAGIVGGRGQKTASLVQNRATLTTRQPGSSIKPISVYGPAMDAGIITPYSVMRDEPYTEINGSPWPRNDSGSYSGNILIRNAVAKSVNTIAVKTLAELTPEASYNFLTEKLNFRHLVGSRTASNGKVYSDIGLAALGLGGLTDGVTVREMAGAYTIFLNQGQFYEPHSYTKVLDSSGATLLSYEDKAPVIAFENEKTAYYMNETLKGVVSFGTARAAKIDGMDTAGKTGTTTANRDRWFCGYTPYYIGACWFGYDENYKLSGLRSNPATNLWKTVMSQIHQGLENKTFPEPETGFSKISYCTETGLLPRSSCPTATGYFYEGDEPQETCHGHSSRYSRDDDEEKSDNPSQDTTTADPENPDGNAADTSENTGSTGETDTTGSTGGDSSTPSHSSSAGTTENTNNNSSSSSESNNSASTAPAEPAAPAEPEPPSAPASGDPEG